MAERTSYYTGSGEQRSQEQQPLPSFVTAVANNGWFSENNSLRTPDTIGFVQRDEKDEARGAFTQPLPIQFDRTSGAYAPLDSTSFKASSMHSLLSSLYDEDMHHGEASSRAIGHLFQTSDGLQVVIGTTGEGCALIVRPGDETHDFTTTTPVSTVSVEPGDMIIFATGSLPNESVVRKVVLGTTIQDAATYLAGQTDSSVLVGTIPNPDTIPTPSSGPKPVIRGQVLDNDLTPDPVREEPVTQEDQEASVAADASPKEHRGKHRRKNKKAKHHLKKVVAAGMAAVALGTLAGDAITDTPSTPSSLKTTITTPIEENPHVIPEREVLTLDTFMDALDEAHMLIPRVIKAGDTFTDIVYEQTENQRERNILYNSSLAFNRENPDLSNINPGEEYDFLNPTSPLIKVLMHASNRDLSAHPELQKIVQNLSKAPDRDASDDQKRAIQTFENLFRVSGATDLHSVIAFLNLKTSSEKEAAPKVHEKQVHTDTTVSIQSEATEVKPKRWRDKVKKFFQGLT